MDRLRLVSGLAVGVALLGVLGAVVPVRAATGSAVSAGESSSHHHYRLRVVAGDARFLVYSKRRVDPGNVNPADTTTLLFRTLHGKAHRIGSLGVAAGDFSLAGPLLVYEGTKEPHWRNLATGAHGTLPSTAFNAAPDGWIGYTDQKVDGKKTFVLQWSTFAGKTVTLGSPFSGTSKFGVVYAGGEVIVYNSTDGSGYGAVKWVSLSRPGVFHTIIPNGKAHSTADCPIATSSRIACEVYRGTPGVGSMRIYSLHGKHITTTHSCPVGLPAVLGNSVAWVPQGSPCAHHLRVVAPDGTVHTTTTKLLVNDVVSAFGGVVVPTKTQKQLVFFTSATNSRTLVQTL